MVGGEEGGRAPIVVEDKLAQDPNNPPGDSSTHVIVGQAEPGHDFFAVAQENEAKSHAVEPSQEEIEDKVVSTMEAAKKKASALQESTQPIVQQEEKKDVVQQEEKKEPVAAIPEPHVEDAVDVGTTSTTATSATSVAPAESIVPESESKTGEKTDLEGGVMQEHGPVVEEVAEADRVREELFKGEPSSETS